MRDHCIVCGAGDTGREVVRPLHHAGVSVVVVDRCPDALQRLKAEFADLVLREADATDEETLQQAGITSARGILLVLPSDRDNLFLTFTARQMQPALRIVSRCNDPERHRAKMIAAGANSIVSPGWIGSLRMVSELVRPHATELLDRLMHGRDHSICFREARVPLRSPGADRTLGELGCCASAGVVRVVAIRRFHEQGFQYAPPAETRVGGGDRLVFFGEPAAIERLTRDLGLRLC